MSFFFFKLDLFKKNSLFLAALGFVRAFGGLSLAAVCRLLNLVAFLVVEH